MSDLIGFTGSRKGMTGEQRESVKNWLRTHRTGIEAVRHGDCKGADEQLDGIAKELGILCHIFPPEDDKLRAYCDGEVIEPPAPYISRNHAIVDGATWLIATPSGPEKSQPRSGTWATVRYARRVGVPVILIGGGWE